VPCFVSPAPQREKRTTGDIRGNGGRVLNRQLNRESSCEKKGFKKGKKTVHRGTETGTRNITVSLGGNSVQLAVLAREGNQA